MSIRPQDVSERGRRSTLQKQPRSRDVSVTAALLAEKENKVYLPDLPLIVCTWGLSVEKIPESEMNSPRSGWRDADMPFSVFFFAKSACVFFKAAAGPGQNHAENNRSWRLSIITPDYL